MHIHKIVYIKTFKIAPTCFDPKTIIDFERFNINDFMNVHQLVC